MMAVIFLYICPLFRTKKEKLQGKNTWHAFCLNYKENSRTEMEEQMKKILLISLLVILIIPLLTATGFARGRKSCAPGHFLTLSFFINPVNIGYKHRLFGNLYATTNLDYRRSITDLELQTGAVYLFPHKIIIFTLYGGGGIQFSRNEGYQYPYLTVGTNFLFLFTEIIHPLENGREPNYRFGFSFKF